MGEFLLRKKDITPICKALSRLAAPFCICSLDGAVLYRTPDFTEDQGQQRLSLPAEGGVIGEVRGEPDSIDAVVSVISGYLAGIKEKKELANHTLNKYREFSFISKINDTLSGSIDLAETLARVSAICHDTAGVENCSIIIRDPSSNRFILKAVSGRIANEEFWMGSGEGVAGKVLTSGKSVILNNPAEYPDFREGGRIRIRNLLCVPLRLGETVVGVINLSNKKSGEFTSEDESLIFSISSMVAGAIETSRLLEEKIRDERFATIGQMASGIIHDIKNPMATIKGFAGLLGDLEFTPEERKQYSKMIVSEVDRLVLMIEDLLTFSRGFKTKYSIESVRAGEYIREALAVIEKSLQDQGITVELNLEYDGPVMLDREKFKRVLFNLTGNAREAMHDGGKLLVLLRNAGESVELVISDTGPGIPVEILETLFEPFVTMGKKKGTGLGLAITKRIVEDLGGSIRAENGNCSGIAGYNGANFIIHLPSKNQSEGGAHGPSQ